MKPLKIDSKGLRLAADDLNADAARVPTGVQVATATAAGAPSPAFGRTAAAVGAVTASINSVGAALSAQVAENAAVLRTVADDYDVMDASAANTVNRF